LIPVSGIRTPHLDLLYKLLNAHIKLKKAVLDPPVVLGARALEEAKWSLQKLELLFADSLGKRAPTTMAEIYQMISSGVDNSLRSRA